MGSPLSISPRVSVVVIGRNEAAHLSACLESVRRMSYPADKVELIYVDSGSRDTSREIAAEAGAAVIPLMHGAMTAARGRNAGWQAAAGDFILFLDGDTEVHPDFVREALKSMTDAETAAVWGHRRESRPEQSVYNRVLNLDWMIPTGWTDYFGGDVLIRRAALIEVDGYNPALIAGEEPEMCRRLRAKGWRILHIDHPMTMHDLRMYSFSQYWKRSTRAGHAYAEVSSMFARTEDPFWAREAGRNRLRAGALLVCGAAVLGCCVWLRSLWPAAGFVVVATSAVARSAWKVRARSRSWQTLLLFGMHSHFQEIPIFLGQVRYFVGRMLRRQAKLIEYHRPDALLTAPLRGQGIKAGRDAE